ncbi:MAG: iron-containing alcohol dehydrogenase [Bosea sp. (in: a-proteobacteria)]
MTIITYLAHVRFEAGALAALPEDVDALRMKQPLIVTDRGVVRAGLLEQLRSLCASAQNWPVFDDTPSNPTEEAAEAALALYRAKGCDGVIGFGGGSPIDLAKAVALMATHQGGLANYALIDGGLARITAAVAPIIAVPTTAGTGSEVGRAALVTVRDGRKLGLVSPHLIPKRAICDPDLTLKLPPQLTAATGMDALSHCIETFLSPRINPPAEAIALDGAGRIWRNLGAAVRDGTNAKARWELMMGALEGGMTFQKGLGAVHGLSHALGALKQPNLHHGLLNAVLLPPVLRHNAGHVGDKYARLAAAMGLPAGAEIAVEIEMLNRSIGLPASLAGMGVSEALVDHLAVQAQNDHSTGTNPRPMTVPDYAAILRAAI